MRISKLDGLRGLFSLMIVLLHYRKDFLPEQIYNFFIIRESYVFVDFFFVLSGFVISYNYSNLKNWVEFAVFLKKRIARLYPLLIFSCTIFLIIELISIFVLKGLISYEGNLSTVLKAYFESILFTDSTPILGKEGGINIPTWSISSEMISYIIFALVSIISIGRKKKWINITIILSSISLLYFTGDFFSTTAYGFARGLVSFNMGYFVYLISQKDFKLNDKFEFVIPIVLTFLLYGLNEYQFFPEKKMILGIVTIPLFFSLSILIFLKTDGFLSRILKTRGMTFLGEISYSLYLNHFIFLSIIPTFIFKLISFPNNYLNNIIVLVITVSFVIIYSVFTHKVIELRVGKHLKNILLSTETKRITGNQVNVMKVSNDK